MGHGPWIIVVPRFLDKTVEKPMSLCWSHAPSVNRDGNVGETTQSFSWIFVFMSLWKSPWSFNFTFWKNSYTMEKQHFWLVVTFGAPMVTPQIPLGLPQRDRPENRSYIPDQYDPFCHVRFYAKFSSIENGTICSKRGPKAFLTNQRLEILWTMAQGL